MSLNYLVREPALKTDRNRVLIFLHGYGGNEGDVTPYLKGLSHDWIVVSLRAPVCMGESRYCWSIRHETTHTFDKTQLERTLRQVKEVIDELKRRYSPDRGFHVLAFGEGAVLGYILALTFPQYFDRVAVMSGYLEEELVRLENRKAYKNLTFFVSHGMDDRVIPLQQARESAPVLAEQGILFTFREYMAGHEVNRKNYLDLMTFFSRENGL